MTLQQLHYAIVISETGSMNKAAERLYIAQPSLTGAMQELERELGIAYLPENHIFPQVPLSLFPR